MLIVLRSTLHDNYIINNTITMNSRLFFSLSINLILVLLILFLVMPLYLLFYICFRQISLLFCLKISTFFLCSLATNEHINMSKYLTDIIQF